MVQRELADETLHFVPKLPLGSTHWVNGDGDLFGIFLDGVDDMLVLSGAH